MQYIIFIFLFNFSHLTAQSLLEMAKDPKIFIDAEETNFNQNGSEQELRGDVVVIGQDIMISADEIKINKIKNQFIAKGHVFVVSPNQIFNCAEIVFNEEDQTFLLKEGSVLSVSSEEEKKIKEDVLGITPDEVDYELSRKQRLNEEILFRKNLALEYRTKFLLNLKEDLKDIESKYSNSLKRTDLIISNPGQTLSEQTKQKRKRSLARRAYWQKNLENKVAGNNLQGYFKIEGERIEKIGENFFQATRSNFTSCEMCEENEQPAWKFSSESMDAQIEGYANFKNMILKVKGIPVLYIPYLKIPLKSMRQSGFLLPTFETTKHNGFFFSQPFFVDINPYEDATFYHEYFEKRGPRFALGLESDRSTPNSIQSTSLYFSILKDKLWIKDQIEQDVYLNSYRGSVDYQVLKFFNPKFSLVIKGESNTDHRYVSDFYSPSLTGSLENPDVDLITKSKFMTHYDDESYYLGLRSSYGDYVLNPKRSAGYQLPKQFKFNTRLISMPFFPSLYGHASLQSKKISEVGVTSVLGEGMWHQTLIQFVTMIPTRSIFLIDHFTDLELRLIQLENAQTTTYRTLRTGFNVNLPMEGIANLGEDAQSNSKKVLNHNLNLGMSFSLRPSVVVKGQYGNDFRYFKSDSKQIVDKTMINEDLSMIPHQKVTFFTDQSFILKDEVFNQKMVESALQVEPSDYDQRAIKELSSQLDQNIHSVDEIIDSNQNWQISLYEKRFENIYKPLNFHAEIGYDFLKEEERERRKKFNKELEFQNNSSPIAKKIKPLYLLESWTPFISDVKIDLYSWILSSNSSFNIYQHAFTSMKFGLSPPIFLNTFLGLSYTIDRFGPFAEQEMRAKEILLATKSSNEVSFELKYGIKDTLEKGKEKKFTGKVIEERLAKFSAKWVPLSGCWGLKFEWLKDYNELTWGGTYYLAFILKFLGTERPFGNIASQMNP